MVWDVTTFLYHWSHFRCVVGILLRSRIASTFIGLCLAIVEDSRMEIEKIAVAAVFHYLGI